MVWIYSLADSFKNDKFYKTVCYSGDSSDSFSDSYDPVIIV